MKKRILCVFIAFIIIILDFSFAASAAEENRAFPHALAYSQAKDMKIEKNVQAVGAIEYETGRLIIDTNIDERFCPEGNTAILMAVYTALSNIRADSVTVPAGSVVDPSNNVLSIKEGMKLAVTDAVAAALYYNDINAVFALALSVSDTVEGFIALMNRTAETLKMANTKYTNLNGRYDANQFTTVSDLLVLSYMCYRNEIITNVTSSKSHFIKTDKVLETTKTISNSFPFVDSESEYYNGNIFGIGMSKDSKGITTSMITYITAKQKFIFVIRSKGSTAVKDVVDTLDFVKKNYALVDISKIIFELGNNTTLDINGEKVYFTAVKNSVSTLNVVVNLYYSKSVTTVNAAYTVQPPDELPESVKSGDIIKGFRIMYNGSQISTVNLMVKSVGEEKAEEKTLGFTVYQAEDVHLREGSFIQEHSWIILVIIVALAALAAIIVINRVRMI